MIKIILLAIYLMEGSLVVEQKSYQDEASCVTAAEEKNMKLILDPKVDGILGIGCIPSRVQEAQNK